MSNFVKISMEMSICMKNPLFDKITLQHVIFGPFFPKSILRHVFFFKNGRFLAFFFLIQVQNLFKNVPILRPQNPLYDVIQFVIQRDTLYLQNFGSNAAKLEFKRTQESLTKQNFLVPEKFLNFEKDLRKRFAPPPLRYANFFANFFKVQKHFPALENVCSARIPSSL